MKAKIDRKNVCRGFVDIHHHLVYGLDDGPKKLKNSLDMIDLACQDKIKCIIATPHVYPGMEEFDRALFESRIKELEAYVKIEGYDLRILPGSEIYYTNATIKMLNDGSIPTLANTSYVLVEWRSDVSYETLRRNVRAISNAGYTPIIAHIERYDEMVSHYKDIAEMVKQYESLVQVDCQAIYGKAPLRIKRFVHKLLRHDIVDFVGTDAHNIHNRSSDMLEAYYYLKRKFGAEYARKLTEQNQLEILHAHKRRYN